LRNANKLNERVAVLFLDSDRFKEINDNFGHAAGDAVLVAVADRVRAQLREEDLVARLGGDEFAVLLTPLHKIEDAERIADKILASMEVPIPLPGDHQVLTSLSIGIAVTPIMARHRSRCSTPPTRRCTRPSALPEALNTRQGRSTLSPMFKSGANSRVHSFPLRLFTITLVMAILTLTGCQSVPQKA
jgi:diguanylate cyclase (GGDEF)-like protein